MMLNPNQKPLASFKALKSGPKGPEGSLHPKN